MPTLAEILENYETGTTPWRPPGSNLFGPGTGTPGAIEPQVPPPPAVTQPPAPPAGVVPPVAPPTTNPPTTPPTNPAYGPWNHYGFVSGLWPNELPPPASPTTPTNPTSPTAPTTPQAPGSVAPAVTQPPYTPPSTTPRVANYSIPNNPALYRPTRPAPPQRPPNQAAAIQPTYSSNGGMRPRPQPAGMFTPQQTLQLNPRRR